jgi:phospholipid N-methyltransferase
LRRAFSFLQEFHRNRYLTGSVLPSSRFLSAALVKPLSEANIQPKSVIEIGPGTGPVTELIIPFLRPGDRFFLVEANPKFCEILESMLKSRYSKALEGVEVSIKCAYLEEMEKEEGFDFAISGLPLNNFPVSVVRSILKSYQRILKPGGTLSYFEYLWIRPLKARLRIAGGDVWGVRTSKLLDKFIERHEISEKKVILNVPPAIVRYFQFNHDK